MVINISEVGKHAPDESRLHCHQLRVSGRVFSHVVSTVGFPKGNVGIVIMRPDVSRQAAHVHLEIDQCAHELTIRTGRGNLEALAIGHVGLMQHIGGANQALHFLENKSLILWPLAWTVKGAGVWDDDRPGILCLNIIWQEQRQAENYFAEENCFHKRLMLGTCGFAGNPKINQAAVCMVSYFPLPQPPFPRILRTLVVRAFMEAVNIQFAPKTGTEEEWNEAYARLADYFRSYQLHNRIRRTQLILETLRRAAEAHKKDTSRTPTMHSIDQARHMLREWLGAIYSDMNLNESQLEAAGRLGFHLSGGPARWPNFFLDKDNLPADMKEAMLSAVRTSGPGMQVSKMTPRDMDLGIVSDVAEDTFDRLGRHPILRYSILIGIVGSVLGYLYVLFA